MMVDDDMIAQVVARAARPDFPRWAIRLRAAGFCAQPIRLSGSIRHVVRETGETRLTYSTADEPDGILLKACETRRRTRCPACAAVYQGDARILVLTGLAGGKGIPETVASHPTVFTTLTAPSFGPVHTAKKDNICHQVTAKSGTCPHGLSLGCGQHHGPEDALVGTPLCPDCYDYQGTVIWNALCGELWRRTTIGAHRALARLLNLPVRAVRNRLRLSFVKVIEYQRRGVVHLHAVIRLDGVDDQPPPADTDTLAAAVYLAAATAAAPNQLRPDQPVMWGRQLDITPVVADTRRPVARYLAKYATKSTDDAGALDRRLRSIAELDHLNLNDHQRRLVQTAWRLGTSPKLRALKLRNWAHTLGYRGHWLTKSQQWSTTFSALREARHTWQLEHSTEHEFDHDDDELGIGEWTYAGTGYQNDGDAWLAASAAKQHARERRTAWEERQ